jgi:hypothetical protein
MESLLNILWALIAIATISVWRLRWVREPRASRRRPACEWTAMIAALVLLFFAVSLSDDLRALALLSDDGASGRRHALAANAAANFPLIGVAPGKKLDAATLHPIAPVLLTTTILLDAPLPSGEVFELQGTPTVERALPSASGRAPPVVNL